MTFVITVPYIIPQFTDHTEIIGTAIIELKGNDYLDQSPNYAAFCPCHRCLRAASCQGNGGRMLVKALSMCPIGWSIISFKLAVPSSSSPAVHLLCTGWCLSCSNMLDVDNDETQVQVNT